MKKIKKILSVISSLPENLFKNKISVIPESSFSEISGIYKILKEKLFNRIQGRFLFSKEGQENILKTKDYQIKTTSSKPLSFYKLSLGFTLVELVLVITILAIISTIGAISYFGYTRTARDSARIQDLSNIHVGLKTSKQQRGAYPYPDSYFTLINSGSTSEQVLQGKLSEKVAISGITEIPSDPKNKINYGYSVMKNRQSFQLAATLENEGAEIALLDGDYKTVTKNMFPSLFLAMNGSGQVEIREGVGSGSENREKFLANRGSLNLIYDFNTNNPVSTATDFDSIFAESGIKLSGASSYRSCEEIYEAGKFMGDGEYQIMTETGGIINTICGEGGTTYVYTEPVIDENTNLYTLNDEELKLAIEDSPNNEITDNWETNDCSSETMVLNESLFTGGNQIISSQLVLSANTIYKVPAGTYIMSGNTTSNGHISFGGNCIGLIGAGTGQTIFSGALTGGLDRDSDGIIGIRSSGSDRKNIIVSGLTILNSKTATNRYNIGIYVDDKTSNITLKDIEVSGSFANGIQFDDSSNYNFLSNIKTYNNGSYGLGITFNSIGNEIKNVESYGNFAGGIYIDNYATNNHLENIITYSNTGAGINIQASSTGNTLSGIIAYNNTTYGLNIGTSFNNINNSKIYNNLSDGVYLLNNINTSISNTDIYNNKSRGIYINGGSSNYINNLNIFNNNTSLNTSTAFGGISVDNTSPNNSFNNLNIFNNSSHGIALLYQTNNNFVNNVSIYNNQRSTTTHGVGLFLDSSSGSFLNNIFTYNNYRGITNWSTNVKYYGILGYFGNQVANDGFPSQGTDGLLGFSSGTTNTSGAMDCSRHINPNNALNYGATCTNRGYTGSLVTPITSFNFGSNIPKQSRPVKWNGTAWELYGTDGVDYDTTKYIGQW